MLLLSIISATVSGVSDSVAGFNSSRRGDASETKETHLRQLRKGKARNQQNKTNSRSLSPCPALLPSPIRELYRVISLATWTKTFLLLLLLFHLLATNAHAQYCKLHLSDVTVDGDDRAGWWWCYLSSSSSCSYSFFSQHVQTCLVCLDNNCLVHRVVVQYCTVLYCTVLHCLSMALC